MLANACALLHYEQSIMYTKDYISPENGKNPLVHCKTIAHLMLITQCETKKKVRLAYYATDETGFKSLRAGLHCTTKMQKG